MCLGLECCQQPCLIFVDFSNNFAMLVFPDVFFQNRLPNNCIVRYRYFPTRPNPHRGIPKLLLAQMCVYVSAIARLLPAVEEAVARVHEVLVEFADIGILNPRHFDLQEVEGGKGTNNGSLCGPRIMRATLSNVRRLSRGAAHFLSTS